MNDTDYLYPDFLASYEATDFEAMLGSIADQVNTKVEWFKMFVINLVLMN